MKRITIAKGDGIGPEIMDATLSILKASGVELEYDEIEIGEKAYLSGNTTGIPVEAWDSIRKNKVLLKAPITTPQGGGYKSLNVTMRKTLGLYANVRPCKSLPPYVDTKHPNLDLVVIRENEEDLYAGIEHQQTDEVVQCLKLISRPGCEKIVRYAFEYAKAFGRKKVTCFSKDNIMKQTDGLFHRVFDEIAAEYPEIEKEHWIIDIATAKLADTPEHFDVIVTSNLYGDIISDVAAQIAGSVGLAGSSNIGDTVAMFEAIHGSAPDIAGKKIANPSGLLQGAILMLNHLDECEAAEKIQNAWLKTIEDGVHTGDIFEEGVSSKKANTQEFAQAVIDNLGQRPSKFKAANYQKDVKMNLPKYVRKAKGKKELIGVDIFVHWVGEKAQDLADILKKIELDNVKLQMVATRGVKVWPNGFDETFLADHLRCRFITDNETIKNDAIVSLLQNAVQENIDVIKTENLYKFDGKIAFSLAQGQ